MLQSSLQSSPFSPPIVRVALAALAPNLSPRFPIALQARGFAAMAPSRHADEGGQLQLMEPDRVDDEEECFESIDKRKPRHLPSLLASHITCSRRVVPCARASFPPYHPGRTPVSGLRLRRIASVSIRRFAI